MMKKILFVLCFFCFGLVPTSDSDLINGREALPGEFPEIVNIFTNGAMCSAALVGPHVILTAGHCVEEGVPTYFLHEGNAHYVDTMIHPIYPEKDLDIAIGFVEEPVFDVQYASIGGEASVGDKVLLTGYGCINQDGTGGNDGVLRVGESLVVGYYGYDFVTMRSDGAALCFGDSGGPALVYMEDAFSSHHYVMGVNSKGDIEVTSYLTRTDLAESREFFVDWADLYEVDICGITVDCSTGEEPEPRRNWFKRFLDWLCGNRD
jgi:hypothetical protein